MRWYRPISDCTAFSMSSTRWATLFLPAAAAGGRQQGACGMACGLTQKAVRGRDRQGWGCIRRRLQCPTQGPGRGPPPAPASSPSVANSCQPCCPATPCSRRRHRRLSCAALLLIHSSTKRPKMSRLFSRLLASAYLWRCTKFCSLPTASTRRIAASVGAGGGCRPSTLRKCLMMPCREEGKEEGEKGQRGGQQALPPRNTHASARPPAPAHTTPRSH